MVAANASSRDVVRQKAATLTLSRTVRVWKGFTIWKVRPIPMAQIRSGLSPAMLSPLRSTFPRLGA